MAEEIRNRQIVRTSRRQILIMIKPPDDHGASKRLNSPTRRCLVDRTAMQYQARHLTVCFCGEFDFGVHIFEEEAGFRLGKNWVLELAGGLRHQAIPLECDQNVEA